MPRGATESKPATIYDVAKHAGVSHQTVARLLQGRDGIRPSTRERIEQALVALDYRQNVTARNLRLGRTGMISLAIPSLNQPYFAELAQAVIVAGRQVGVTVLVETTESDRQRELSLLAGTRGHLVDGVLFAPATITADDLTDRNVDFPLVLLGDRVFHADFDHVVAANSEGARAATEHLIGVGRRRILAVGAEPPDRTGAAQLRLDGYRGALQAAGIPLDESRELDGGAWLREDGVRAIERAIAAGLEFDAVFAFNDAMALGALRALYSAGLRVPDDVALIGFDDTQDGRFSTPSLSTIAPELDSIAAMAVAAITRAIDARPGGVEPAEQMAAFHLVVRESTTSARAS